MISKRQQNRAAQRERILDAARAAFAEYGLERVTMTDIAVDAGVARATVFNYFPSKHALIEAITEDVYAYFRDMLESALAADVMPVPTLVRTFFVHMGKGIEEYQGFYSGIFREIVGARMGLDEGGAAYCARAQTLELLEQLMRKGQSRGEISERVPASDLAAAFDSLANGTIVHWLYEDMSGSLGSRMQSAAEIFLGAVAEPPYTDPPATIPVLLPGAHNPAGNNQID